MLAASRCKPVGSSIAGGPQEVIDRYAGMREHVGDYQRQLFLMDHAGLPLRTVLEQLDILSGEVVPALRREFAGARPARVPSAPTHASLLAQKELTKSDESTPIPLKEA